MLSTNTKRILLTGGRAPATLDLARKFKKSGHEVYVAESISYHLCRYSNAIKKCFTVPSPAKEKTAYINALVSLIQKYQIDLIIPTCEEVFYISSEMEKLNSLTKVFTDKIDILHQLHNKFSFNEMIEGTGISVPKTVLISSLDEYKSLVAKGQITYPHVLKPAYSRFASQTKFVFTPGVIDIDISTQRPWVAQTYIQGELVCTYSICYEGKILANIFYSNHYSAGEKGAGISFKVIEDNKLLQWVAEFVKNINYTGQIAFDVILASDNTLWPIECNPRATSGIHLFSDAQDISDAFLCNNVISNTLKSKTHPMLSLAMLIYGLPGIRSLSSFLKWANCFFAGKDVIFRWSDPLPFMAQFFSVLNFFKISRRQNISIIEATTHDIEWNGDL